MHSFGIGPGSTLGPMSFSPERRAAIIERRSAAREATKRERVSSQQFFHGTRHDIEHEVLPGAVVGKENFDYTELGRDRHNWAFVADDEATAWEWATAGGRAGAGQRRRERVYRVAPEDPRPPKERGAHFFEMPHEFTTPRAKVLDRIDIPPPSTWGGSKQAVQGTLPPVNWRQFGGHNSALLGDVVDQDERSRKTTADWMVQGDAVEARVRTARNLRFHPRLFDD